MSRNKRAEQKRSKFAKYIPWIVLFALFFPSNYTGRCSSLQNVSGPVKLEKKNYENIPQPRPTQAIKYPSHIGVSRFSVIQKLFSLSIFLNHVAVVILNLLILGYLNAQPIVKQSLLLYLNKDFICILTTNYCAWVLVRVLHLLSGNGNEMNETQAKVMSFLIYFMRLQAAIFLNLIAILNLYIMKKAIINPPMPWGDDEDLGIKIIRLSTFVPTFFFMTTMYMFGMYPTLYYSLINGYTLSLTDLPIGAAIFITPLLFLVITLLITHLVAIHYKSKSQQNLDTGLPQMYYYLIVIITVLILIFVIFLAFGVAFTRSTFAIYSISTLIVQVVIILKNSQLTSYVKSYLSFDLLYLNVRFVCMCLCINVLISLCVN